jgi:arylsulfatase A-like enzyme
MLGVDGRRGVFARFLSWIDDRSARLYFLHSMLPHTELEYVPSGRQYSAPSRALEPRRAPFQGASAAFADMFHQRYLAQVGAVDRLLGDLIARLREVGVYDKALVVITADHGASYREGEPRRWPQQHNLSDILEVPLLIKLPDQHEGKVVDRIAETIDILPTILDVVGANASLHLEGQSLVAAGVAARSSRTYFVHQPNADRRTIGDLSVERARSLERKERRFGRGEVAGLYASPRDRHLLGMNLATLPSAPDVQITIRNLRQYAAVDWDRNPLPLFVEGRLTTSRSSPLIVAVAINGVVAAVTQSYRDGGAHAFGTLVPETSLRDGANAVTAVVVDESSSAYSGK